MVVSTFLYFNILFFARNKSQADLQDLWNLQVKLDQMRQKNYLCKEEVEIWSPCSWLTYLRPMTDHHKEHPLQLWNIKEKKYQNDRNQGEITSGDASKGRRLKALIGEAWGKQLSLFGQR